MTLDTALNVIFLCSAVSKQLNISFPFHQIDMWNSSSSSSSNIGNANLCEEIKESTLLCIRDEGNNKTIEFILRPFDMTIGQLAEEVTTFTAPGENCNATLKYLKKADNVLREIWDVVGVIYTFFEGEELRLDFNSSTTSPHSNLEIVAAIVQKIGSHTNPDNIISSLRRLTSSFDRLASSLSGLASSFNGLAEVLGRLSCNISRLSSALYWLAAMVTLHVLLMVLELGWKIRNHARRRQQRMDNNNVDMFVALVPADAA